MTSDLAMRVDLPPFVSKAENDPYIFIYMTTEQPSPAEEDHVIRSKAPETLLHGEMVSQLLFPKTGVKTSAGHSGLIQCCFLTSAGQRRLSVSFNHCWKETSFMM